MTRYSLTLPLANAARLSHEDLYAQVGRRFALAEDLGYDTAFTNEHHFSDFTVCPDTMVLLAYAAARTERVRLGTSVVVTPWQSPIRTAEQLAMVDQLSNGRLLPGLGRGTSIREFEGLGVDPEESRGRFEESVEVIRRALAGERFDFEGPFHRYTDIELMPTPVQNPMPLVGASTSPPSCEILGRLGIGLMVMGNGAPAADMIESLRAWQRASEAHGHDPAAAEAIYHGYAYVADSDEQAYAEVQAVLPAAFELQIAHYEIMRNRWRETTAYAHQAEMAAEFSSGVDADPAQFFDYWCDQELVGSPETVARRIRRYVDGGFNHVSFYIDFAGAVDIDRIERTAVRLAEEVLPLVDRVEPAEVESPGAVSAGF